MVLERPSYLPGPIERGRRPTGNARSVLRLPRRLVDADLDRERLAGAAIARAAQGRRAEIVEAHRHPNVGVGGADAVRRIESHPAEGRHERLGPGVAGLLLVHAVLAVEIAAHVARRDGEAAGGGDEDVGEVLADAALEREGRGGRGGDLGGGGVVHHLVVQAREHEMQQVEHVALGCVAARGGKGDDARVGTGERGLAQIEGRGEALDRAAHHALGVARFDLALDRHGKLAEGAVGGEGMNDVAEGVLVLIEPAIGGDVDAPARHVLPVVIARGEPQHLDHAGGGFLVAIARQMRDADAHEHTTEADDGGRTTEDRMAPESPVLNFPSSLLGYIRYCSVMAAPRRLLSSMNSPMNSCIPCWKISSMRLFSSRARTARAWRWAGPWRP